MRTWALAVVAAAAAAAPRGAGAEVFEPLQLRTVAGRELHLEDMHAKASEHGFLVQAVHSIDEVRPGVFEHIRHHVAPPKALEGRRLQTGAFANKREQVRAFLALNAVAYRDYYPFSQATLQPVLDAGDSNFGAKTYESEQALGSAWFKARRDTYNYTVEDGGLNIDAFPDSSYGVYAIEYVRSGFGTVLCFRGSANAGDWANIKVWLADWWLTRMNPRMQYAWLNIAKLTWTDDLKAQQAKDDPEAKLLMNLGLYMQVSDWQKTIGDLAASKNLSRAKAQKTGYWEFTKVIVESVVADLKLNTATPVTPFYLTGHSQGGGRASLVSMYLKKKYNLIINAITFGGVGTTCFTRKLRYTGGDFLDDVDPYVKHTQIIDYQHPLDILGDSDIDQGYTCRFGGIGLAASRAAKYCAKVFGVNGPTIILSGQNLPVIGMFREEIGHDFERCRYFTHGTIPISWFLNNDSFIDENGTTDMGCELGPAVPAGDKSVCPDQSAIDSNRFATGCEGALSCESCMVSSSKYTDSKCVWCDQTKVCKAWAASWFETCPSSPTGPKGWQNPCNNSFWAGSASGLRPLRLWLATAAAAVAGLLSFQLS